MPVPGATNGVRVCVGALLLAACVGGGEPPAAVCDEETTTGVLAEERHGTDCVCCHEEFGVAGSIDPAGSSVALVRVVDARGRRAEMVPNPYGNFFRHFALEPPLTVSVQGQDGTWLPMRDPAPHGSCNRCHRAEGGPAPPVAGP